MYPSPIFSGPSPKASKHRAIFIVGLPIVAIICLLEPNKHRGRIVSPGYCSPPFCGSRDNCVHAQTSNGIVVYLIEVEIDDQESKSSVKGRLAANWCDKGEASGPTVLYRLYDNLNRLLKTAERSSVNY